jgi:asparagine synthase (glutamine-hydrolysing)
MCGICGFISQREKADTGAGIVRRMCALLQHRGPDEEGVVSFDNVSLGHCRLSIIDLADGQQPMSNPQKSIWIVFNGEIYNYRELRAELEREGFCFRTRSDTEVILHGYAAWGLEILGRLNGMFAFAIYDRERERLFAARDRLGKKPLYYHQGANRFLFASELKGILADPAVPRDIDLEAVDKYFSYTQIPAPLTAFASVKKLRPGHYLLRERGELSIVQYWDVRYELPERPLREEEYVEELDSLLRESVRKRMISDVPLGAFLSGGIDSSTVVALMSALSPEPVKTFSIGFRERRYSELDDAKTVANALGTGHHEQIVAPDAVDLLPEIVWQTSEPFADSSAIPTYCVSRFAREKVTVALSGDGGDELFAGYTRYLERDRYAAYKKIPRVLREKMLLPFAERLPIHAPGKYFLQEMGRLELKERQPVVEIYPNVKRGLYAPYLSDALDKLDPPESSLAYWQNRPAGQRLSDMQYLDTKVYLPEDIMTKVDRMSMANSLETRAPLLDYRVVEFAASIPPHLHTLDGKGKYLLRKVAGRYLPPQILEKKKQGFALPVNEWFRGELHGYARELLTSDRFRGRGYFNQRTVETILGEHAKGRRDYSTWIWCLVIFELWHQAFVDADTRRV